MISNEEYADRRFQVMDELGNGILILPSNPKKIMSNDVNYKYRQHSDLLYLCGFPEPNTTLIIEKNNSELKFHLSVPPRNERFETWNGRRIGIEGANKHFNPNEVFSNEEFNVRLVELLKNHETVFYPKGENQEMDDIIERSITTARAAADRTGRGPYILINPLDTIHSFRAIKSKAEIDLLKKCIKISADAHMLAMKVTRPGLSEYEIEAIIAFHFRKNGTERAAYESIVASGLNATILHYIGNQDQMKDGSLLLVDAGAEFHNYAADITRTWPISGKFSDSQKEIYNLVLSVQKECIEKIEVGKTLKELNEFSVKLITIGLVRLGLLEGDIDELIKEKKHRRFYMHGLSHWLGIDVHDTPFYERNAKLLVGHCFTVEPGIYIPDDKDIPEKYRGIGVRIEDDVLLTENGPIILSASAIKEIDEIEAIVGSIELPYPTF